MILLIRGSCALILASPVEFRRLLWSHEREEHLYFVVRVRNLGSSEDFNVQAT